MLALSAAIGGLVVVGAPALASAQQTISASYSVSLDPGEIRGVVRDQSGTPVAGTVISALGTTTTFTVTDSDGQFELLALAPGPYLLRAHAKGYQSLPPKAVDLGPGERIDSTIAMRDSTEPAVLAAGFEVIGLQDAEPAGAAVSPPEAAAGHDTHDETAWRLRHARRGVLRSARGADAWLPEDFEVAGLFAPLDDFDLGTAAIPIRIAANLIADTPFSGQVNILTSGSFDSPDQLFAGDNFSRQTAHVRVGAPAGHGDWTISGAVTQADISAWVVAGSYLTRTPAKHQYDVGLSYSTQRYDGGNPLALRGLAEGSRNAGSVHAFDTMQVNPAVTLSYGARYARYDYLDRRALMSPRVEVTLTPVEGFRLGAGVSRRAHAPGAEEFLPPSETGIWLPPQRTFSSVEPEEPLRAEHSTHVVVSVEQDIASSTVAVKAYRQDISNQLATVFGGKLPGIPAATVGHYLVGNVGDVEALGYMVEFRTAWGKRVSGSVSYSSTEAQLDPSADLHYLLLMAPSTARPEPQRIHSVSTRIEADVEETATKVLVIYNTSNGFAWAASEGSPSGAFDSRFDVQVRQSLPFVSFSTARWEMLLAVRNFFRETTAHQSVYDELLVVRPPTRVVGGVTLYF